MTRRSGLTFVELLIAVLMVSILFVGLSTHLRAGMTVWERVTQSTEMRQRERTSLERLEKDLANAFVFDERATAYGTPSDTTLLSPAVFSSSTVAFYSVPPRDFFYGAPVQFITYWCGTIGNHSGLWRQRRSVGESRAKQGSDPELILPECERVVFSYAYLRSDDPAHQSEPLDWRSSWLDSPKALPRMIQMEMTLAERVKRRGTATTTNRTLKYFLLVPAGVLKVTLPP